MAWHHRIRNAFRRNRVHREADRELAFHIAERIDELRASGMSEQEARLHARLRFGNLTAQIEETSDMNIALWLDGMLRNLRLAVRSLIKTPAFTATVVLTLALGIGANSAVFSALDAVVLRPLPFPEGDQLMRIDQHGARDTQTFVAPVRLKDWQTLNGAFQSISGFYIEDTSELSGELPEKLRRTFVAPAFLQVLGVAPAVGRPFTPAEEMFGGPPAVLISDRYWRRRFQGNPSAVGKQLRIGGGSITIVGVMPANFRFPDADVDLWAPSPFDAPFAQRRELTWFTVIGRVKPGVSLDQARANMATIQANLGRQYPKPDGELRIEVQPLKETAVGGVRRSLWLLFGSVSLLLLIACTNIAALLLARATQRQQEVSVRYALGASRASVAWQLLTEAFVLAITGAAAGLLVAAGASQVFRILARDLPRIEEIRLNAGTVFYTLGCAVIVTLLCGLIPAIRSTRRDLRASLAEGSRSQVSGRGRVQWILVGVQVALAVTLLAGAGLLVRSFQQLARISPGFDPAHILTFQVSLSWAETGPNLGQQTKRMMDAVAEIPGVTAAAMSYSLPGMPNDYQQEFTLAEGRADSDPKLVASSRWVSPSYFTTIKMPLVAGEMCRLENGTSNGMVNRSFADTYLGGAAAIGLHLRSSNPGAPLPLEIRGIIADAREDGLSKASVPTVYYCGLPAQPGTYFLVRTQGEPMAMAEIVRRKIHDAAPARSVFDLTPLEEHLSDSFAENRLRAVLLSFFALTAIALACVGLYGTLSYFVSVRRREVGLRLALGSPRGQIVLRFLKQGLIVSALGCVAGLALAAAFNRVIAGMLYGVSPSDGITLSSVILAVLLVTGTASLLPAVRASRVDPMQVLRDE